ncbi:hypothetical protein SCNRRL3882_0141 [Streptomyces chartreusis NRRL 3882]|uniref:Uncharacterized protein n=1 Tax=Streptomyces chartreusis NRRL 3882 TaxID=1079985 RepID=A0A2N9B014_STRCX|nr:hypothetical protein SCNRRL3882_0141 [Streptomyces chartreusis NRRL 3882]
MVRQERAIRTRRTILEAAAVREPHPGRIKA